MNNAPSSKSPALAPLRAIFRAARNGSAIDPQALVAAIGSAVVAGVDVTDAMRAFEPFALIRAALAFGGWRAAIRMASILGWSDVWAAAMTAHYGPTGTHASRLDADGRPTAETLAAFPEIGRRMADAAERFERLLGWYERNLDATRWQYVVTPMRAAA